MLQYLKPYGLLILSMAQKKIVSKGHKKVLEELKNVLYSFINHIQCVKK